jgi:prepilin-type N-terminal cleavage/methylation domain-containing protein
MHITIPRLCTRDAKRSAHRAESSNVHRSAFTLVELLVVIAIISVLVALGVGAGYVVVSSMRVRATENAMRTIQKCFTDQWKQVVYDASKNEDPSPAVIALAGGDVDRARILWIKIRLAEAFPLNYSEIRNAMQGKGIYGGLNPTQPWIPNKKYMAAYNAAIPVTDFPDPHHNHAIEPAACLFLALSVKRGNVQLDQANLAGFITEYFDVDPGDPTAIPPIPPKSNDALPNGRIVKILVDNWGQPLQFQRFATNPPNADLVALNPRKNTGKDQFGDPLDPGGLLQQQVHGAAWCASPSGNLFANMCNHPFPSGNPQPYYVPYIFSAGSDETFGTNDDIFSYRLKVGSQ